MQQYQASARSATTSLRNSDLQSPTNSPSMSNAPNGSFPGTPTRGRSVSYTSRHNDQPARSTPLATPISEGDLPIMEQAVLLGEDRLIEKIQGTIRASHCIQDRVSIMEMCGQAVAEEPASPRLWRLYGDWMWILFKRSNEISGVYEDCALEQLEVEGGVLADHPWTEEDIAVGKEVFQWDPVIDTWRRGAHNVQWHLDNSNIVWDPYLELAMYSLTTAPSQQRYNDVHHLFLQRLQTPHRTWEDTKNLFAGFISRHNEQNISPALSDAKKLAQKFQSAYDLRAHRENTLQQTIRHGDQAAERRAFEEYLSWEEAQHRHKTSRGWGQHLYIALLQRATMRFPKDVEFWLDYVIFLMEPGHDQNNLLDVAERATRYCSDSGDLWAERLYAAEACDRPYKEIETVKHNATSTGQLEDNGNMQELIKVESAWCGYLRRTAFSPNASEDSKDVAEVAIRSAIENVARVGRDKFGDQYQGDPEFRVERIFIKFLTQDGRYKDARDIFYQLERTHGKKIFFWERWYLWEMAIWETSQDRNVDVQSQSVPAAATSALKRGMQYADMDWPEKIVEMYLHHCAQQETSKALLAAQVESRKLSKQIAARRKEEQAYYEQQQAEYELSTRTVVNGKRPYEDEDAEMSEPKRPRTEEPTEQPPLNDPSSSATAQLKRDREHTTIVVRHLPGNTTEQQIRHYFHDCGEIKAVSVLENDANDETTATVEFESPEDVLTAQTKTMKTFGDNVIEVQIGTGTTLFVTNYPSTADETYMRSLFKPYGDVVEVRFPSLKANTHRRFCYIQYISPHQAAAGSAALHNRALEHGLKLVALLSDPTKQQARQGATDEGREIYIGNFNWSANEADLRQLLESHDCSKHLDIARIPRRANGQSKGAAFAVFATKEAAELAVQRVDKRVFRDRVLTVTISRRDAKGAKKTATTVVRNGRESTAASEASSYHVDPNGSPVDTAMDDRSPQGGPPSEPRHLRTIALLNIPDTVNDARIRALCEQHGPLVKVIYKPENGGALVEYEKAEDKNRAEMALGSYEITSGNALRIGEAREVFGGTGAAPNNRGGRGAQRGRGGMLTPSAPRPALGFPGKSRGGRGGRPGAGFSRTSARSPPDDDTGRAKNQDDFRAMLSGGKTDNKEDEAEKSKQVDVNMEDKSGE